MARIMANEVEHYGGQGGGGYFSLRDDGDTARVRFLYDRAEDVVGTAVHPIKETDRNGKTSTKNINCLRTYRDPVDVCPFCAKGMYVQAKIFIPVYNMEENRCQVWERGKTYISKIAGACARYAPDGNFVGTTFDIERRGKFGETSTTYELYKMDTDDTTLESLAKELDYANAEDMVTKTLGKTVLDKTADEMNYYLEHHSFPADDNSDSWSRGSGDRGRGRDRDDGYRQSSGRTGRRIRGGDEF